MGRLRNSEVPKTSTQSPAVLKIVLEKVSLESVSYLFYVMT